MTADSYKLDTVIPFLTLDIFRSEYFNTALNTAVGGLKKSTVKVEECSVKVLSAIIDFMYGKSLEKKNFNWKL